MTCRDLQALLVDRRLGELSAWTRARLSLHAAVCPCCRAMIETYDLVVDVSGDLGDTKVPDAVVADVEAMLARFTDIS